MITTANYIVKVVAEGETYVFEYETGDVWTALQEFWHEDWDGWLSDKMMTTAWPLDVMAMETGNVIKTYELAFEMSYYHHFYDHGHITLNEFSDAIRKIRADLDAKKSSKTDVPKAHDVEKITDIMDRWAHFCYSHPPYDEVILWMVGDCKHYLYQHFCSKFLHLCEDVCNNDTMSAWMKFYRELDDQWAERLMEYVYCEWKN
jgi:hypothetical protein